MNMQGTIKKRLLTVCVALGLFATANPLAADGPGRSVKKAVAGMVVNHDCFSGPVRCPTKNCWVCYTPYLNDRFSDPLKTVWEGVVAISKNGTVCGTPWVNDNSFGFIDPSKTVTVWEGVVTTAVATKDGVISAARETRKGVVYAAKATRKGVVNAATSTGNFFKRGWEKFGW